MKMTKKLIKEIIGELKEGIVREDLIEVQEMTDTALKNFEDIGMDELKPDEKNPTLEYFIKQVSDELMKRSDNKEGANKMLKVANNKVKDTDKQEGAKNDTKKQNKGAKNDTKNKSNKNTNKTEKDTKKEVENKEVENKVIDLDTKVKELKFEELDGKVKKASPLAFSKIVANKDHVLLLSSEYGLERVIVLDVDTDEEGKEYALIKSLDNKATYDFIYKSKAVRGKKGTYKVKNNGGEEYNVIISLPQAM